MADIGNLGPATMEGVERLSRDLRAAAITLSRDEARFLTDAYYTMQDNRIRSSHQMRTLKESGEPHTVLSWLATQDATLEKQIAGALKRYVEAQEIGKWATSIVGIGPVITAGILSHIEIGKARTAGDIWRFAGLDPSVTWEKGQKRPWNAALKRLAFLMGESFVKVQANERDVYGKVYAARKELEIARNEAGEFAEQAAQALATKRWRDGTDAKKHYESGKLPPARIHMRAKRYAVKLFLSHLQEVWWFMEFESLPPVPYVFAHLGHANYIAPPNLHLVPGFVEAKRAQGQPV